MTPSFRRALLLSLVQALLSVCLTGQSSTPKAAAATASMTGSGAVPAQAETTAAPAWAAPGMAEPAASNSPQQHLAPLALTPDRAIPSSASDSQTAESGKPQALHLIVGRSVFLNFSDKLRRVYVSNPTVLDAMTASPYEVVITGKAAGTSSLVVWDAGGPPTIYTVMADVDVEGLRESLHQALPGDSIEVTARQGRIHLTGVVNSDAASDEAARLAAIYSKDVVNSLVVDPRHLPQVQLQVRIAEVDRSKLTEFGINFFSLGKNSGSITTQQFSPPGFQNQSGTNTAVVSDFLNLFYFNFDHGLGLTIRDMQNKGILEILAEPTLTTLHGKTARFLAGGQFPYPIVQPGGAGSVPTVTVEFQPYGVKLEFTPFVNSDGSIRLKVAPEVSALDYTNQVVIAGYVLPALSTRKAETEVELKDGQSFGISGILDHRTTDNLSKIPGIGDIPVLGQLFRSKNLNRSTMELIVIVTPRIVDPLSEAGTTKPATPALAVPFLEPQQFDHNLTGK